MAVLTIAALWALGKIDWPNQILGELVIVVLPGAIGAATYLTLMNAMKVPELGFVRQLMRIRNPL